MRFIHLLFFLHFANLLLTAQSDYHDFFTNDKLRFDYSIEGNSDTTVLKTVDIFVESNWGGSKINTIDTFQYGELLLEVYDLISNSLIFSRGYSSLFKEWQTTPEADTSDRIFYESVILPYPRNKVRIEISERDIDLSFRNIFTEYINPLDTTITSKNLPGNANVYKIIANGTPANCVDLVFLSEGYRKTDSLKFLADVHKKSEELFLWAPYTNHRKVFNVYAVFVPSENKSEDNDSAIFRINLPFSSRFNTFGSERYLTTEDIYSIRDALAGIPYDQICIVINSKIYGGGGIYNYLTLFTSDNEYSEFLFHHEFGHGFASLADEYYSSVVPYESYFNLKYEPYQPNITTQVNFSAKWTGMVHDTIPIPTPNMKKYNGVVGMFEGAGYTPSGVFRSFYDCSMKSKINNAFCPVCRKAIEQMILFYTSE